MTFPQNIMQKKNKTGYKVNVKKRKEIHMVLRLPVK